MVVQSAFFSPAPGTSAGSLVVWVRPCHIDPWNSHLHVGLLQFVLHRATLENASESAGGPKYNCWVAEWNIMVSSIQWQLHWLLISLQIQYKVLMLIFKAVYSLGPSYLQDWLTHYNPPQSHWSLSVGSCRCLAQGWLGSCHKGKSLLSYGLYTMESTTNWYLCPV